MMQRIRCTHKLLKTCEIKPVEEEPDAGILGTLYVSEACTGGLRVSRAVINGISVISFSVSQARRVFRSSSTAKIINRSADTVMTDAGVMIATC
jgi:hypothetical protein